MSTNEFTQLDLHSQLVQALDELGYTTPTPIQAAVIPAMLTDIDIIGQAQTGTGKTAAFSLPILNNLAVNQGYIQSLVLTPTRELAMQVATAMEKYGHHLGVQVLAVYGGQAYHRQIGRLKRGVDIVVGTPGRLLDLVDRKVLDLSFVSTVVLDEADEMLSMGFIEDIETILDKTPPTRQTALFSATLPKRIRRLADRYMQTPQSFILEREQLTVATIEQRYYLVNEADKSAALARLFEIEPISSALIFVRTRAGTGELANELTARGFPAEALNGDMSQDARVRVLNRFRHNQSKVLVATDVAARGLDIDDISHVFNYDLPQDPEIYVHRVGRTARAGKTGTAITLLTPKEQWQLRKIETYTKQKVTKSSLPTVQDIQTHRESKLVEQMMVWLKRGRCRREQELVTTLIEEGHDPVAVAAAALKLARAEEKERPIAPINEVKEWQPRQAKRSGKRSNKNNRRSQEKTYNDQGMVRLTLNTGKAHGIRVNHVVSTLASHANVPGHSFGKIRIQNKQTFVDVPEQFVSQVLAKTGSYRIGKQAIRVEQA
jgi:ATP-dependent RNA helicase DeaD